MLQVEPRPGPRALERTLHRRPADPAAELSVDNMKRRKDTSELYLGERGIEKIDGAQMATFANLAVLWLNDNKLTKLKGLDANFRLTALYLQNNRISSISSPSCSLPALRFLETLLLQNNEITDLSATLGALERLPRLSTLNLFGNPVAEETNYRPTTVHRLKALQVFDQHAVTHAERQHADELFSAERIRRRYAFGQRTEPWERPEVQPRYSLSATEKMLRGETERVRARQRAREAAAEHEAQYSAQLPTFQLAIKDRSAPAGMRTERVAVPPKGHTPCICASIGVMRCADGLLPLVRAADATHVFLTCELWGIPAAPIRTEPADLRALGTGEIDFKLARIVTSGREAEAYEVILSKAYVRRPTGREYRTRLELFALERDGVDSKHPIATGTVDLVQVGARTRAHARVGARVCVAVCVHTRGCVGARGCVAGCVHTHARGCAGVWLGVCTHAAARACGRLGVWLRWLRQRCGAREPAAQQWRQTLARARAPGPRHARARPGLQLGRPPPLSPTHSWPWRHRYQGAAAPGSQPRRGHAPPARATRPREPPPLPARSSSRASASTAARRTRCSCERASAARRWSPRSRWPSRWPGRRSPRCRSGRRCAAPARPTSARRTSRGTSPLIPSATFCARRRASSERPARAATRRAAWTRRACGRRSRASAADQRPRTSRR